MNTEINSTHRDKPGTITVFYWKSEQQMREQNWPFTHQNLDAAWKLKGRKHGEGYKTKVVIT